MLRKKLFVRKNKKASTRDVLAFRNIDKEIYATRFTRE